MMLESQLLSIALAKHQVIIQYYLPNMIEQSGASQVFEWLGTAAIQLEPHKRPSTLKQELSWGLLKFLTLKNKWLHFKIWWIKVSRK